MEAKTYKITLGCRAISFRYNEIDDDLKSKLKSADDIDVLWMDYLEETSWYCEETQKHWVSDRFVLTVEDEDGDTIYESDDPDEIVIPVADDLIGDLIPDDGTYFARTSTWKDAGWTWTLNTPNEFNPELLAIPSYIEDIYYDDDDAELMLDDMDGTFEEQYWETEILKVSDGEITTIEVEDL